MLNISQMNTLKCSGTVKVTIVNYFVSSNVLKDVLKRSKSSKPRFTGANRAGGGDKIGYI